MSRYIDRDKLCDFARNRFIRTVDCDDIMRFPVIDVEEVVRCKDCKYCEKFVDDFGVEKYFCVYFCGSQETEQNGYCYRGRKQ